MLINHQLVPHTYNRTSLPQVLITQEPHSVQRGFRESGERKLVILAVQEHKLHPPVQYINGSYFQRSGWASCGSFLCVFSLRP